MPHCNSGGGRTASAEKACAASGRDAEVMGASCRENEGRCVVNRGTLREGEKCESEGLF